jgi:hypothetical protein
MVAYDPTGGKKRDQLGQNESICSGYRTFIGSMITCGP